MTPELPLTAAALVDDIAGRAEQDALAFAFRLGYGHGYDIGWHHGAAHQTDAFFKLGKGPTHAELQRRRYPPDGDEAAWLRRMAARPEDHKGGPVPWHPDPGTDGDADREDGREGDAA
jgi:hypothetical protein